ncbi:MAG: hypothetical protein HN350_21360 [Phycisphaerales bacterium]|jgi:hypothetical protein|nr:hypothetical protein [Phycisphaerales bacterium]
MRITSIELTGTSKTTLRDGSPGLPGAFARISRLQGDDQITVELLTPGNERSHEVQADDRDDQWSMAQILQHALDGYEGSNSEINEYLRIIEYLAD